MEVMEAAVRIAELAVERGGRAYYVGGFVRDRLMCGGADSDIAGSAGKSTGKPAESAPACGTEYPDIDIEVHGVPAAELPGLLREVGEPIAVGESFGVYKLKGLDIDVALPRKERAIGRGHRDFEVFTDPFIGTREAARRRDFTINALMEDILTGEIIDHFGGREDLGNGVIRHVDAESFVEDPLRVLRGAQFAARFDFGVAKETNDLCRTIDLTPLSKERVCGELEKALVLAGKPSLFFETLREMDQLSVWFPEIEELIGLEQDPVYHPEGDVWTHTMEVLDRAAEYRSEVSDPFSFMMLALSHDLGKITTTEVIKGRIHSYGHEAAGAEIADRFISRLTNAASVRHYVLNMIPLHMKPNMTAYAKSPLKSTNRMFDSAAAPRDLIYLALADRPVFAGSEAFSGDPAFLFERLAEYEEIMARPYVQGRDLIDAGISPGKDFSELLAHAHKLRLAGVDKESALKQTLGYARTLGLVSAADGEKR